MKSIAGLSLTMALLLTGYMQADATEMDMSNMAMGSTAQGAAVKNEAVGVVDEIHPDKGTVTISHEAIKSLGWPAMTMDFVLKDKKLLHKLSKGKKIHFEFIQQRGDYVITNLK